MLEQAGEDLVEGSLSVAEPHFAGGWHGVELLVGQIGEPAESRAILDVLFAQARVPEYQFRIRWTPGTIVFWDNRSTQHYAANDYYPQRRRMERTAVVGDVPV